MVKECKACGKEFKTNWLRRKYCCQACYQRARVEESTLEKVCPVCGKAFTTLRYRDALTCSDACGRSLRKRRVTLRCEVCGKPYRVKWGLRRSSKYCSMECVARRNTKPQPSRKQLEHMLVMCPQKEIAEKFGVSTSTVRNWARRLGIDRPTRKQRARLQGMDARMKQKVAEEKLTGETFYWSTYMED